MESYRTEQQNASGNDSQPPNDQIMKDETKEPYTVARTDE